ncbi:TGc domain-containing protein, partial [Podarcis lilfordi]
SGATGPNDPPHISSWKRIVLLVPQTNQATAAVQVEPLKKKEIPSTCTEKNASVGSSRSVKRLLPSFDGDVTKSCGHLLQLSLQR